MHQPDYRVSLSGEYHQPWTYLHAIKDYVDMAMHLERVPDARAVINFTPTLLDQLEDYARQITDYLTYGQPIRDPLLHALTDPINHNFSNQIDLVGWCMRAHRERVIERYPAYRRLVGLYNQIKDQHHAYTYLSHQYVIDLLMWYHLGWLAEIVKRTDTRIKKLLEKSHGFDKEDRLQLITVISELISSIVPRYKTLAKKGQIELTTTPYAHPILPLLLDFKSATEAMADIVLPQSHSYPGGGQRATWHMREGLAKFIHHFGTQPDGCWPSEGGLSSSTCKLIQSHGFKWTASGNNVLMNSAIAAGGHNQFEQHRANQLAGQDIVCFFRDDELSDLIGFEYSDWHADDAVANIIHRLMDIRGKTSGKNYVVSIILDGENAWEHYPENGYYFLSALYKKLSDHPFINMTTFQEYLQTKPNMQQLTQLVAGSWVYGTFTTWIGSKDKNYAWDLLCSAKKAYDECVASGSLSESEISQATTQLAKCEASDWFWWFGDYNPAISVASFEKLFLEDLIYLYQLLKLTPPENLYKGFTSGNQQTTESGSMRRSSETN